MQMHNNMRIYKNADGAFSLVINGELFATFSTIEEAVNMSQKLTFVSKVQERATTLAQVADLVSDLVSVYFDRGYDSGGSDPVIDADLAALGITAANLTAFITLGQQLQNFLDNAAVATADYDATLNTMRTDV